MRESASSDHVCIGLTSGVALEQATPQVSKAQKRRQAREQEEAERERRIAQERAQAGDSERVVEERSLAQLLQPLGLAVQDIPVSGLPPTACVRARQKMAVITLAVSVTYRPEGFRSTHSQHSKCIWPIVRQDLNGPSLLAYQ